MLMAIVLSGARAPARVDPDVEPAPFAILENLAFFTRPGPARRDAPFPSSRGAAAEPQEALPGRSRFRSVCRSWAGVPPDLRPTVAVSLVFASMSGLLACPQLLSDDFDSV